MARKCSICSHPDLRDIDSVLVEGGGSNRDLSRKYLVSEDALARHRKNHLPVAVSRGAEEKEGARGKDLLDRIRSAEAKLGRYESIAVGLATRGFKAGDYPLVLRALAEARRSSVESRLRLWDLELRVSETRDIAARLEEIEKQIGGDQWVR